MNEKRNSRCKLTIEQENNIAEQYSNGRMSSKIAKEFDISVTTVRKTVRRAGINVHGRGNRYRQFSETEIQEMGRRYHSGESQESIAAYFKSNQITVSRVLREHGLIPNRKGTWRERVSSWKGGRITNGQGYVLVLVYDDDPMVSMRMRVGYVQEHRLVMARSLGRPLTRMETVHHINGDKGDNRIENLQLRYGPHGKGEVYRCADCGSYHVVKVELAKTD